MATVEELLRGLVGADADLARDGRILLAHLLGSGNPLALRADAPVPEETARRFEALGAELRRGAPVQYLIGEWDFFGRTFFTDARALIPRPETEHVVEEALRECPSAQRIADLGCGSGILAVTLALERPGSRVVGVDRSPAALALSRQNARRHGVHGRVSLVASDWLAAVAGGDFDLVVSNPPYVALADRASLPPRVRQFEPAEALFAGADGLSEIRRLLDAVPGHLRPGGVFCFELGFGQEEALRREILRRPAWTPPRFARDLAGISRVAVLRRSSAPLEYPQAALPQRDSPTLQPGDRLGPYEILSPLGAGGMGEVYRARDTRLHREIAIKTLPERLARDADALARFEREARAVAALSHPNILAIHDFGQEKGICFCVTELLEGETLRDRLRAGSMPVKQAVEFAHQIALGLAAAHEKGIVHRDLKPENIFLTRDGRVKILDFGLARVRPPAGDNTGTLSESPTEARPTDPGTLLGTVGYMSPEQVRGEEADARSDLFSFGCVLYEMATGRRAFSLPTAAETLAAILQLDPPGLRDVGVLPEELRRITAHCLEKTPSERFQSARDLAYELRALQDRAPGRAGRKRRHLAILPFENASGDPEAEYLSEGLTEGLINALAPLPGLRVRARNTVYRYRGRLSDPREVGRDLQVDAVVTGRLLARGETLTLQIELVDCSDGSQLWGEQFQRTLADVFTLQEEILRGISGSLKLRAGRRAAPTRRPPKGGARAYNLYLEGRFYWNKRNEEAYLKGIELFRKTLEEDPRYAPAYAGLSDCYTFLGGYGHLRPREAFARAKEAAQRALEIDDSLDEAHNSLGIVLHRFDWNWAAAEREFRRSLRLNPANVTAHHWYGVFLLTMGRFEEAMAEVAKARELDPLSLVARQDAGYIHFCRREYLGSAEECREILRIEPSFTPARFDLGLALAMAGHTEEAISETRRAADQAGGRPRGLAQLAYVLARVGLRDEAATLLAQLVAGDREDYVPRFSLALVQVALGNLDEAFRWLELSYEEHEDALVSVRVNPRLEPLRADPRFRDLERRIGF